MNIWANSKLNINTCHQCKLLYSYYINEKTYKEYGKGYKKLRREQLTNIMNSCEGCKKEIKDIVRIKKAQEAQKAWEKEKHSLRT